MSPGNRGTRPLPHSTHMQMLLEGLLGLGAQRPGRAGRVQKTRSVLLQAVALVHSSFQPNRAFPVGLITYPLDGSTCSFDPPGPMSAGMSCEVLVTFKPMVSVCSETR